MSPFKTNYRQNPRMGFKRRKEEKYKGAEKFVEKMKKIQKEVKAILSKVQMSQTSFGHISIKSLTISMVLIAPKIH